MLATLVRPEKKVISKVSIANYRKGTPLDVSFPVRKVSAVIGPTGSGKTSLWHALWYSQMIARGASVTTQVFSPIPYGATPLANRDPIAIGVDFVSRDEAMRYAFSVSYDSSLLGYRIVRESLTLTESNTVVIDRAEDVACLGSCQACTSLRYPIPVNTFALSTFTVPSANHPVQLARNSLANLFLVSPNCNIISDDVRDVHEYLKADCSNFCTWVATFFSVFPAAYQQVAAAVVALLLDFEYLAIRDRGPYGRKMVAKMRGCAYEIPFVLLSSSEKLSIVMATVRVACSVSADSGACIWDDAFAGMSHDMAGRLIWDARVHLANGQGVYLTSDDSLSEKFSSNETIRLS